MNDPRSLATGLAACLFALAAAAAAPAVPLVLDADTPWIVAAGQPEAVDRALTDVQRDWYKVFGHRPVVLTERPAGWRGPIVRLGLPGTPATGAAPASAESFVLQVRATDAGPELAAAGDGTRGVIYAAYAMAEEVLGVDPLYFWTDHEPEPRRRIEVPSDLDRRFGPPTFRYRGWFINDEDLLAGFAPDPLRENVFSLEMWDRLCETLLRLRGNTIVPGTFTFPDERCQELASRRGLVLNMHHILVVGLNTYRWPRDVPFSYARHPDVMERAWQTCIDAFRGRETVWTVGYRGKHDRPFWVDEPDLSTPAERGGLITRAIAKQVEMVRKADPNAAIIANLWDEGADLIRDGHLTLPDGVTQVWPDDGSGLIRDGGAVRAGQGIYYHTAMLNSRANQLSEMVNPGRIYAEMGRFVRAGATAFFLVNVSDIRPVPLSTDCAMRMAWNAAPCVNRSDQENMDAFLRDWSRRQFGEAVADDVADLYARYFDIPYHRREVRRGENHLHTALRRLDDAARKAVAAGTPVPKYVLPEAERALAAAASNRTFVAALAASAAALRPRIPPERAAFYQAHVLTPVGIHLHSLDMQGGHAVAIAALGAGDRAAAVAAVDRALRAADELSDALRAAEVGKWAAWYGGEGFVGIEASRDRLRVLAARLRGEPPPPERAGPGYAELYRYQEPFRANFPLLYPGKAPAMPVAGDPFDRAEIVRLLERANAWQVANPRMKPEDRNWERGTWYTGVMAAHRATGGETFLKQALDWGRQHAWQVGTERQGANRLFCVETWAELYLLQKDPAMIAPAVEWLATAASNSPAGAKVWYLEGGRRYADSLYGACTLAMMTKATGDAKYLDFMHAFFWDVHAELFDADAGLFYRDKRFIGQTTPNGRKVFWSRGNGWVLGGIARVLEWMPADDPQRPKYVELFRTMCAAITKSQGADGLWRPNLDDPADAGGMPESSGTGFFCHAMAWGVRNGVLDRDTYLPVVRKAWAGLAASVSPEGRVLWGQPVGDRPVTVKAEMTHEYVTGTFLLAGSEVLRLSDAGILK